MRYLLIAAFLAPTFAYSDTIGEERGLTINTINATDFEVVETQSMGAADFWCAAASYNELRQGRSDLIPLYVRSPRGPAKLRRVAMALCLPPTVQVCRNCRPR